MAKTLYPYKTVGLDYFERAPFSVTVKQSMQCSMPALVESLAGDESWLTWAKGLRAITWHNKTPDMIGSTRRVEMVGNDIVEETFFHWDPTGRIAFYVTEGSLKPVNVFAENYVFKQVDAQTIELEWTVAIEASGIAGFMMKMFKPVMKMMFQGWLKNLKKQMENA
ncbi:putative protein [BD1-7 clade bacterium]|uniref:SRPBCC family protein n=1 Tax=BD1-7 clade bacterium TaxID=2029982 RepID=A0A5S9PI01_9GAMM|nr:putative protein [BD1-7 clade bacterium]CAA0103371.1 putative protein [BD1-7 clade bacterium]